MPHKRLLARDLAPKLCINISESLPVNKIFVKNTILKNHFDIACNFKKKLFCYSFVNIYDIFFFKCKKKTKHKKHNKKRTTK